MITHAKISRIEAMQPYLHERVRRIVLCLQRQGFDPWIFETLRTKERQWWLLGAGRTSKEMQSFGIPWKYCKLYARPKDKKVTWTVKSKHLVGKAADIICRKKLWNNPAFFRTLKVCAEREGFKTLNIETCHIEWGG